MITEKRVKLEELNHVLRNGTMRIEELLRGLELILKTMNEVVRKYREEEANGFTKRKTK